MRSLASSQKSGASLGVVGEGKLRSLAAALDLSEAVTAQAQEVFSLMSGAWGDWSVGETPLWPSDVSDDGTPFEFSASFDGHAPRLRMLVESQAERISRNSSWEAGLALNERLRIERNADLSLFEVVKELFVPHPGAQGRFSLWHAAVIEEGHPALFKAYVNPCLFGVASAPTVVEQALKRLGFEEAWRFLKERLAGNPEATIRYFSVDLEAPENARVKVYLGCSRSAEAVAHLIEPARNARPDDAKNWLDTLTATEGPYEARPILSCFSFRRHFGAPDVTVHVPIRCYVKHDAEALSRVSKLLTATDADRLSRALTTMSARPLNVGRGLLTYASLRREASAVRATVYLAPEAYSMTSRRPSVPPAAGFGSGVHRTAPLTAPPARVEHMSDVQALVTRRRDLLAAQPLFAHLAEEGSPERASRVAALISLPALWLGDLLRFAREQTTDALITEHLTELARIEARQTQQFKAELQALGIADSGPPFFSAEHALIRELVLSSLTDVVSADEDCVRLGIVLSVSAISRCLLSAALVFATRALTGRTVEPSPETYSGSPIEHSLSMIGMPEAIAVEVFSAVDRTFESLLRVISAIDSSAFATSSSSDVREKASSGSEVHALGL